MRSISPSGSAVSASRLTTPGTFTITAAASVADGTVSKVEFFSGATKLGESLAAPFSFAWLNPAADAFSLTAKATDNTGATFGSRSQGLTYGWNVSHTAETRDRQDSVDRRLSTLCQLRSGGVWQIAVPNGTYPVTVGIGDDSDGDGFSNAAEFFAGTNLLDSRSQPQFSQVAGTHAPNSTTTLALSFPTVAGRHYVVDFTDSMAGGLWTLVPGSARTGDGSLQTVSDTSTAAARFFRLRVWP